jgi:HAD superfamily hydrolase (TIGR01490 family)
MIVALFDSDGTLYTGQFGRGLMKYSSEHDRKYYAWRYYASIMPSYFLYKAKIGNWETIQRNLLAGLSGMLQGFNHEQADVALRWLLHEYLLPTQRPDVMKRLKEHQAQGHKVIVISGMLMQAAQILREILQIDAAIGSQPELINGRYTGKTLLPHVSGQAKVEKAHELIKSRGWDVDWSASYAYGDSFTDQNMLSMVGNPVTVYPDAKLYRLAKEKRWEVLGTPRE